MEKTPLEKVGKKPETWNTRFGAILAVAGCAIGLGNYLRFPGQAAMHGGGAFLIPYFIAFFLLAIPLSWGEWALGRFGGRQGFNSVPGIFAYASRKKIWFYLGGINVLTPLLISMYYIYIQAWCMAYAVQYLVAFFNDFGFTCGNFLATGTEFASMNLGNSEQYAQFFNQFIGTNENGSAFHFNGGPLFFCVAFCFLLNYFILFRGISRGIEVFCSYAMPLLFISSFIILFRVITLGNPTGIEGQSFLDGLGFMWNPSRENVTLFQTLSDPKAWLAATSQIFFSVSLGFGLILTYASYVHKDKDIVLSSLTAVSGNGFCEVVLAGIMIIPAAVMFLGVGYLTPENLGSSFSMGFITLPNIFAQMPFGNFFGFLFFFLLFLAAVTSAISMSLPSIVLFEEGMNWSRTFSVLVTAILCGIGTFFIVYFSKDATALATIDFWAGNLFLFILATFEIILVGWIWGADKVYHELERGAEMRVPRILNFILKYVSPLYLILIFVLWLFYNFQEQWNAVQANKTVQLSLLLILGIILFYMVITFCVQRRWEKQKKLQFMHEIPSGAERNDV
ncbi:MAG: sodium-dependent transporter [Planctomycetia bacterium]|nr:sodium-dependent transporter [Planctomycetia bacterium]